MFLKLPNLYPYYPTSLREEYPNTSFPLEMSNTLLAEYDVYPVLPSDKPTYNENTQKIIESAPELIDGQWTQQWLVVDLTEQELEDRVPKVITALQGMLAIKEAGLVSGFLYWKSTLDPVDDFETISFLEKAQTWTYDDPILNSALVILGIEDQKAALFTLASTL